MKSTTLLIAAGGAAVLIAIGVAAARLSAPQEPQAAAAGEANLFPFVQPLPQHANRQASSTTGAATFPSDAVRQLFDYYLDAQPPLAPDAMAAEIEKELDRRQQPAPPGQTRSLLDRYAQYRSEAAAIDRQHAHADVLEGARARLSLLQRARTRYFSAEESRGLFAMDEAIDRDLLARLEILAHTGLTPEQQQRRLAELDAAMSPALRQAKAARFGITDRDGQSASAQTVSAPPDIVSTDLAGRGTLITPEMLLRQAEERQR